MHPLVRLALRRLGAGLVTLFVVSVLIFLATEALPGDVAQAILGRNATPEAIAELRAQLGLDQPAVERFGDWLGGVLTGDFGQSAAGRTAGAAEAPIWDLIDTRLANTALLALVTVALLVPIGVILGVLAATRAGRGLDHAVSIGSLTVVALPEFVTGAILVLVFSVWLDILPGVSLVPVGDSPLSDPRILVLPVATLLAASLAQTLRMVRAGMLEALRSDFVQMARLAGYPERRVVYRHALRNALAPTVQVIALNVQWLIGGIIVTEYVFSYPGIGQGLVQAVAIRDVPFVQAVALIIAAVYVTLNIVADLVVVFLIPKLRTAQ